MKPKVTRNIGTYISIHIVIYTVPTTSCTVLYKMET